MMMLNEKSDDNIEIKKKSIKNNKRIEYKYNNFATQFIQLSLNFGMLWLWN